MKKSVIAILSAFALVSFVSCTKDVPAVVAPAEGEVAFTVGGEGIISTEVETRASVVESLSSFHVGAVTGTAGSSETEAWNAVFSGGPTYTGGKFWPASNPNYTFYASSLDMTASRTGYTVSATNATDVVCAYLPNPGFKAVNKLVFEHVFARLGDVTVTAAENYSLSNISITVTPKTGGTYNLFTGAGKTDGTGWSSTTSGSSAGIANATIPDYDLSVGIRITKFALILLGGLFGLLGVSMGIVLLTVLLCAQRSFGVDMAQGTDARTASTGVLIQTPLWMQEMRSRTLGALRRRQQPDRSRSWEDDV